jgi:predicted MFS family arabinose efflux permease|nr:MFS transporter [Kofleriaceae bacterium]
MVTTSAQPAPTGSASERERLLPVLVAQIFLIFFQGFTVAPLVPRFAALFGTSVADASALIPAYMVPYGLVCLIVGPLADRVGRAGLLRALMFGGIVVPALTATASSLDGLIAWRVTAGVLLGGIAPVGLALIAELFPYAERGRPVGWMFGAIAGGMAAGASAGPLLEPIVGWQGLFAITSGLALAAFVWGWGPMTALVRRAAGQPQVRRSGGGIAGTLATYARLVASRRGRTAYGFVLLNGAFHGGVFAWLGVYFVERYDLSSHGVGLAMLGYGIPGFLFGPVIGRLADRRGRRGLVRGGLLLASLCALGLAAPLPAVVATALVTLLSVGFDFTHPLFAGVVTTLDPEHTAQAMAINTFAVFVGNGLGSVVFGIAYAQLGLAGALVAFAGAQLALTAISLVVLDRSWR